jgi:hypothetical protein
MRMRYLYSNVVGRKQNAAAPMMRQAHALRHAPSDLMIFPQMQAAPHLLTAMLAACV